jgi:hypothetical protein
MGDSCPKSQLSWIYADEYFHGQKSQGPQAAFAHLFM